MGTESVEEKNKNVVITKKAREKLVKARAGDLRSEERRVGKECYS